MPEFILSAMRRHWKGGLLQVIRETYKKLNPTKILILNFPALGMFKPHNLWCTVMVAQVE